MTNDDLELSPFEPGDLDGLLAIRLSNPDRLARTEGSEGEAGTYDLDRLGRDVAVALADPARQLLVARRRSTGVVVAYVDVLDEHPVDGLPWVGVVEVAASEQRHGLGRQCIDAVVTRERGHGARVLRASFDEDDAVATAFATSLGFEPIERRSRRSPQGDIAVTIVERPLG